MIFHIQLDQDNHVHDCITYPHEGYVPIELETPLPDGFLGGWYRLIDGQPVFDRELYEQINEVPQLRAELEATKAEIDEILDGLEQEDDGE